VAGVDNHPGHKLDEGATETINNVLIAMIKNLPIRPNCDKAENTLQ